MPWAMGFGLLLLGILIGWASSYLAIKPLLRSLPTVVAAPEVGEDRAAATGPDGIFIGAPGQQLALQWQVSNTGQSTWVVDSYRFVPVGGGARVIALPGPVHPGESIEVVAHVEVPPLLPGRWLAWELTGPDGPVPGGRLEAEIRSEHPTRRPPDPTR